MRMRLFVGLALDLSNLGPQHRDVDIEVLVLLVKRMSLVEHKQVDPGYSIGDAAPAPELGLGFELVDEVDGIGEARLGSPRGRWSASKCPAQN